MINLTEDLMRKALNSFDKKIPFDVTLIMGGGGAMILAHKFPLATTDIDAIPKGREPHEIDSYIKDVAAELGIQSDWLNPYFSTFTHTLPSDYGSRLIEVFKGKKLTVLALSLDEMLIMKCFAQRQKDVGHARALIRKGANIKQVEAHIESLKAKRIPGAAQALDFLDELRDE